MVTWTRFHGGDAEWDGRIEALEESNVFQTSSWARHKASAGWTAVRFVRDGAAIQGLVRRLPAGGRVLWARGGPLGRPSAWAPGLRLALLRAAGGLAAYARVCPYRPADEEGRTALLADGWRPTERPLDAPGSFRLDLTAPEPLRPSTNWAHNLRRGLARAGQAGPWSPPEPAVMEGLYREMEAFKKLSVQHRAEELSSLLASLGPRVLLRRAVVEGRTVAFRACGVFGRVATDLLAASTPEARRLYATYPLLAALVAEAKAAGAEVYDLGGADAVSAKGVSDFKKGTGATPVVGLGEWDAASPSPARRLAGALIAPRKAP